MVPSGSTIVITITSNPSALVVTWYETVLPSILNEPVVAPVHSTTVAGGVYSPGTQTDGSVFDVGLNDPTTIQFALREFILANNDGSYDLHPTYYQVQSQLTSEVIAVFPKYNHPQASTPQAHSGDTFKAISQTSLVFDPFLGSKMTLF